MSPSLFSRAMLRDVVFRVAAATLVVAVVVLVLTTVDAVRLQPVQAAPMPPAIADSALRIVPPAASADLASAVAHDVFADDRQAPKRRYRLPGETDDTRRQPTPRPIVLGTALSDAAGTFAVCQLVGAEPKIVRVGAKLGEFTVVAIERGRVTFRTADGERIAIDESKPVP